jgi:hypothetical protein
MSKKLFKTVGLIATVVAGAALVATGIGSALGGTMMFTAFGASVAASTIATVAGVVSLGASMLSRPKAPATSTESTDRLSVSMDPRTPRKFVLGRTAMATDIRDQEFSNNQEYLHRFVVTSSHKASAIEEIWFDDKKAWSSSGGVTSDFAGYLTVTPILEGSAANAINLSARMGATRRYTGLSYVYFRFKLTGNSKKAESPFAQSIPTRVTIIGKGAPTYDPRLDSTVAGGSGTHRAADQTTWVWNDAASRNPALQLLWYLLGWRIKNPVTNEWRLVVGKGIPAARIDLASFITAANLCDEPVTLAAGGTQPRYRSDGVFSEADATGTVLDQLKAAMNAELDDVDGKIRITVLHNDLATPIADFNDDDILGGFTWDQTAPLDETYNVVRGTFIDPSTTSLYQAVDFPEVRIDSLDGIDRIETVDFQTVQDASQAQRLVKQRIARMLYSGRFTATFSYRAWKVQKNDVIRLTFEALGWTNKLFRVIETAVQVDGQVPMVLQVENADIYLWDRGERAAIQPVQPTSYDPYLNPIYQDVVEPKYADGTVIDELRPAEPGATNGASPEEKDLLAELDADVAQAEIDIAAAQQTIADLQTDAAATQAALTQAQNDIQAQGDEILAAQGDIIANASAISTVSNTVSAQGSSITTLQQTVSGQAGSISTLQQTVATQGGSITTLQQNVTTLQGSVSTLQQTVSTQGSTISQNSTAITTLQGNYASLSSTVSAQGSSITQLQTASSTQAGDIATLKTRIVAGGGNLLNNTEFASGLTGWTYGSNSQTGISFGINLAGATYQVPGTNAATIVQANGNAGGYSEMTQDFPGQSGELYDISVWYGAHRCNVSFYLLAFDAAGNSLGQLGSLVNLPEVTTNTASISGWSRVSFKSGVAPANTSFIRIYMRKGPTWASLANSYAWFLRPQAKKTTADAPSPQDYTSGIERASIEFQASAISTINTQVSTLQTTVSTQGSSITANATAITTLQTQTATLTTQVSSGSPNLLKNGGFENGLNSWAQGAGSWGWSGPGTTWGTFVYCAVNGTTSADRFFYIDSVDAISVEFTQYTVSGDLWAQGSSQNSSYFEILWYNSSGSYIGVSPTAVRGGAIPFGNRYGGSVAAPAGAASARVRVVFKVPAGQQGDGMIARQIKFERGSVMTAYSNEASVIQSFQSLTTLTTQYASLSTTVSTQGVTITQQQTAITTINGNVTTLYGRAALTIEAGGVITGWEVNNNGTTGDIKLRADRVSVVTATGGTKTFEIRQGTIIGYYPNGNKMYQLGDSSVV